MYRFVAFIGFPATCKPVPEIIDPVFRKTSQYARFLLSEKERFGLVLVKTGSINSGTGVAVTKPQWRRRGCIPQSKELVYTYETKLIE